MSGLGGTGVPRSLPLRVVVGLTALAMASPLPWALDLRLQLAAAPYVIVALAALAIPLGRWAVGSWTSAAVVGAVASLVWSYSLADPAAAPFLGLFLLAPYAAFTIAGLIGVVRERHRKYRWAGVVVPPILYVLPFIVAGVVNHRRFVG